MGIGESMVVVVVVVVGGGGVLSLHLLLARVIFLVPPIGESGLKW